MKIVFISALIVTLEAVVPVWYHGTLRCGVSKYPDVGEQEAGLSSSPETFGIAGGKKARRHEFPWTAALVDTSDRSFIFCGATIINELWVLTAAQCINTTLTTWVNRTRVVVGEHNVLEDDTKNIYRKYHRISRYFIADGYRNNATAIINDIALLKLKSKISISVNVRPVCAPDTEKTYIDRQSVVAGWGDMGDGNNSVVLRFVRLNILKNSECEARIPMPEPFSANMMCATDDKEDVKRGFCKGDGGGPLVVKGANKTFSVVGIVSHMWDGCVKGYPGVYTRVSRFVNWISDTIKNN